MVPEPSEQCGERATRRDDEVPKTQPWPGATYRPTPRAKVLIVEDSGIVRERLVALIADVPNVCIVGQAVDGFQAQTLFRAERPDAVVLDLQLPGISGMTLLVQFKQEKPDCLVMVLTTYASQEFRKRCARLGADHFFDKTREFERIPEVLAALRSGGVLKGWR